MGLEQQVEGTEEVVAYLASLVSESSAKRPRVYNVKTMADNDNYDNYDDGDKPDSVPI